MAKYLSEAGLAHLWTDVLKPLFASKVDKVTGKGLSSLDFTQAYLNRIGAAEDGIATLGNVKVNKVSGKGLSTNDFTDAQVVALAALAGSAKGIAATATLPISGWSGNGPYTYTASVTGVTTDNVVLVGPAPLSKTAYEDGGIYPSAQGAASLTFTAESVPISEITVNVVVFNL